MTDNVGRDLWLVLDMRFNEIAKVCRSYKDADRFANDVDFPIKIVKESDYIKGR